MNRKLSSYDYKKLGKLHWLGSKIAAAESWADLDRALRDKKHSPYYKDGEWKTDGRWTKGELMDYLRGEDGRSRFQSTQDFLLFDCVQKEVTAMFSGWKLINKSNKTRRAFNAITTKGTKKVSDMMNNYGVGIDTLLQHSQTDPYKWRGKINTRTIQGELMIWREPPPKKQ